MKLMWLAENCRPDLAVIALKMSRKSAGATLGDLMAINGVVKRVRSKRNMVKFTKIGEKEDLMITGVGDASYKVGEKAICGNIVLLRDKKQIQKICHSSKDAETKNVVKLVDKSMYQGRVVEQLLFDSKRKVGVEILTDSEPLLDSIGSTKQVEVKMMREVIEEILREAG